MAISFVGSHVGAHAATSAQTVNFSSLLNESGGAPTLQQGDIVFVAVENASTVDRTRAQLTPSGYTAAHTDDYRNDSNDSNFLVSYKVMGATPDTSVAIPASNATTAGVAYAIYVFRGVDPITPLDVTPVVTGNINTGVANANAITPVTAGAWIVVFAGAAVAAGAVFTNPAGMSTTTNHFRSATITTTTNDANIAGAIYTGWTSGSYDPAVFGGSTSTNTGSWSAVTLALRPYVYPPILIAATALTYAGQTTTINASRFVSALAAGLAYAGQAITVSVSSATTVAVTAAAMSHTGQAITVNAKRFISVATAALAYAGQIAAALTGRTVSVIQGALTYAGAGVGVQEGSSGAGPPSDSRPRSDMGCGL